MSEQNEGEQEGERGVVDWRCCLQVVAADSMLALVADRAVSDIRA